MNKNITTIDDLARMINEGFKSTATKQDVAALRSEMNEKFDMVNSHLNDLLMVTDFWACQATRRRSSSARLAGAGPCAVRSALRACQSTPRRWS
jgi:hypothetical protein